MVMDASGELPGRSDELTLLEDALSEARSSAGRVILVRGEAGIGKTALVREFVRAHRADTHVLVGSCDDLSTPQPLGPFWDIARDETSVLQAIREDDRSGVLNSLLDLLDRSLRPTILVIDDTQWADQATLDALKYLGRRVARTNSLMVLTYRDGEVDYDHPLRSVIGELRPESVLRIHLTGLSADTVASMSRGTDIDPEELIQLTDGNPLFVSEMLATGSKAVPHSVQDSVLARARKLSPPAREVLDLLSVMPGEPERRLISDLMNGDLEALSECERQGMIEIDTAKMSFRHEIARRAVEASLTAARRQELNRRVLAQLIANDEGDLSLLVHHAHEAVDTEAIISYSPAAARTARAVHAFTEAVAHYRRLEPYLDRVPLGERAVLFQEWAECEALYMAEYSSASEILSKAIELYRAADDNSNLARALLFDVRAKELIQEPEEADKSLREALEILSEDFSPEGLADGVNVHAWLAMLRGQYQRASELAGHVIEITDEAAVARVPAFNTKGVALMGLGEVDKGLEALEDARQLARQKGDTFEEIRALHNASTVALRTRRLPTAHRLATEGFERAKDLKIRDEGYFQATLADVKLQQGEWNEAGDLSSDLIDLIPQGPANMNLHFDWVQGRLETRRGRPEGRSILERPWRALADSREPTNMILAAAPLAENMWITGQHDQTLIEQFADLLNEGLKLGEAWDTGELAFWMWKLGALESVPDRIADPYKLTVQGKPQEAARLWDEIGSPYEKAIALSHGETDNQLEALNSLEELGAGAVAAHLRQQLRAEGVSIPRGKAKDTRVHPVGLTARQDEVLALLAEDLSNAEIADRLFLSPRTVEHHVSAVISKFNVSTREEAVTSAATQGLIAET